MKDTDLIELYEQRDESAVKYTEEKYGGYCRNIAKNIVSNYEDTEECINDTLLKVWQSIPPNKPENLQAYIAKIVRNCAINIYNKMHTDKRGNGRVNEILDELAMCVPDVKSDVESEYIEKELRGAINEYLKKQPLRKSNFFVRRYFFGEDIVDIAKRYGVTKGNVMTTLSRMRKELKKYLEKEGYTC